MARKRPTNYMLLALLQRQRQKTYPNATLSAVPLSEAMVARAHATDTLTFAKTSHTWQVFFV